MALIKSKGLMRSTENLLDEISNMMRSPNKEEEEDVGQQGFEDLRKYIKSGNEFCRDIGAVLLERSDLEGTYAKALSKLSAKLTKSSGLCMGTLADAWSLAAAEMEAEAELHRQLAQSLSEELYKPIKTLADTQHKTRKPVEGIVEKAYKTYTDKKTDEVKYKKHAFTTAKEREKLYDMIAAARAGKGKAMSEKDIQKMEKNLRKLEESLRKYDKQYHEACTQAEQARQEWDSTIYKANGALQQLEEERISQMQDLMNKYNSHLSVIGPNLIKSCEKLGEAVISIDTNADIRKVIDAKGNGVNQPEQSLPDYYAEDMHHPMDQERRRQLLQNYLIMIQQDIEREVKGKEGVEKLVEVYQNRPNFADAEAQEDARHRLAHVNAMLNFLEASHYKLTCAMAELEGRPKPTSKFSQYIERTKDKQAADTLSRKFVAGTWSSKDGGSTRRSLSKGQSQSVLRVPSSMVFAPGYAADSSGGQTGPSGPSRGPADGGHVESMYDDDEFDACDGHAEELCQARALYDYAATQHDELTIAPGDIIAVYDKQADGWWQGSLNGQVGIFPATYVEQI